MEDYSAIESYLEENNLQYFTFSPNSEKTMTAVIHHHPSGMPAEDISNGLEDFGFNVMNMRQNDSHLKSTQLRTPSCTPASIPCYLNKKHKISRDIEAE
jgi:hypothetical protein